VSRVTLLLLSGGGHTGSNVMSTLAARRDGLRVVATSDAPDEPALFRFDAAYLAPQRVRDSPAFERRILDVITREQPDLVVPCRDEDVQWLADLRGRRPDLAPRLLCGDAAIAGTITDKWLSFAFAREHGLPFAPTLASGDAAAAAEFVAAHGMPLIAKPRRDADCRGVVVLATRAHAMAAAGRADYVLQKFLGEGAAVDAYVAGVAQHGIPLVHSFQGDKRSLQALIGPRGDVEHVVCTRNLMSGRIARTITADDDPAARRIGERCANAFAAAGWRGPLNVQCQPAPDGELAIHEFNARFTGATGARWLLGFDEVGAAVRAFTGRSIGGAPPTGERAAAALESLVPRAADPAHVRELAARGEWKRGVG
jgi:carbamoyl-phosphate synthase large subunit